MAGNFLVKNYKNDFNISVEYIKKHDEFITLFRREGNSEYLNIARIFRKAGHKIYRLMLKRGITQKNNKFLNVV